MICIRTSATSGGENISLADVLHVMGRQGMKPAPPLNLLGNFSGGGMMLASAFADECGANLLDGGYIATICLRQSWQVCFCWF